jgi:hypothetical protein
MEEAVPGSQNALSTGYNLYSSPIEPVTATEGPSGEWRRRTLAWYEMPTFHCELCGRPLPGRVWAVAEDGGERLFCGPDCELLSRARRSGERSA